MTDGATLLSEAKAAGANIEADTSKVGQLRVSEELDALNDSFTQLRAAVGGAADSMAACLVCWHSYDVASSSLLEWLSEVEASLKRDVALQPTLDEKVNYFEQYEVITQNATLTGDLFGDCEFINF